MHASFSQDVKSKANPKNHTVESILLDTIDRDNTEELDIFQIWDIFAELARTDILHASIEREPVETDTLFIDIVAYVEDKTDSTIWFNCLYIHIFNIEYINATEFDEIVKEIQDIVDRANAKVIRLESIFE